MGPSRRERPLPHRPRRRARGTCWCRFVTAFALVVLGTRSLGIELVAPEVFRLEHPDFIEPVALAVGPFGNVFVCDVGRGTIVRLDENARIRFEFDAPATQPDLQPLDVAVTGFQVYVLDAISNSLLRYSDRGSYLDVLQSFTERRLETPRALSVDGVGRVLLAQPAQHRVTLLDETQLAETVVGGFGTRPGELSSPSGVAFAPDGAFYVADTDNARIQLFSGVGNWVATFDAGLEEPRGLVVDASGVLFVADAGGAIHAFGSGTRKHAVLEWRDAEPLDVAVQGNTLWFLTREPAALVRVRIVRGD